jgi:hypothetical protein
MYDTIEDAMGALRESEMDVAQDRGDEMVEAAYGDIVYSVASCISNEKVKSEFLRRTVGE